MNNKYDCTNKIICPWCGYELSDSSEVDKDNNGYIGVLHCYDCGKPFKVERIVTVQYVTGKDEGSGAA